MPSLSLRFSGPPTVMVDDSLVSHFRSSRVLALLSYLVLERHGPHQRSTLATLLWPEQSDRDARRNLTQTLTRLRRTLDDLPGESHYFEATRQTIHLRQEADVRCDIWQMEEARAFCEEHSHTNIETCETCQEVLCQAAEWIRGEPLAGFSIDGSIVFDEWLLLLRERWQQRQLWLLDQCAEGALHTGSYDQAAALAQQQLTLEPWRERAHQQRMRSLAHQGDRGAALAQFQRCRQILYDELGVEPASETQVLRDAIERGTLESVVHLPIQTREPAPTNLPHPTTRFFGREEELSDLAERLQVADFRLLSLVGPGGIGKSRLALEAASRQLPHFDDGVYFVALAGVQSADEIPTAVAIALGLTLREGSRADEQVIDYLQTRRLLLVLDNFEHLGEGLPWILELLGRAPRVSLLVTSRQRLNVMAEDLFRLRGLPVPAAHCPPDQIATHESVRLFLDRARRLDKRFRFDEDNGRDIAHICRLVEGLPLGIELATSWVRDLSCAEIAESIEGNLDFLETTLEDLPTRQRSLRATFEYSWELLSKEEQNVLAGLSVFRSPFTQGAAYEVTGATPLVLNRLRFKSLVRSAGSGLLEMHELVRQFSADKLRSDPEQQRRVCEKHALFTLESFATSGSELSAERYVEYRRSIDDIHVAWTWVVENEQVKFVARIVDGLTRLHFKQQFTSQGINGLDLVLKLLERRRKNGTLSRSDQLLFARVLVNQAGLLADLIRYAEAEENLNRAHALLSSNDDPALLAAVAYQRGRLALHRGNGEEALTLFEGGHAHARSSNDRDIEVALLREIGSVHRQRGDYLTFLEYLNKSLPIIRSSGDEHREMATLYFLGSYTAECGRYWSGRRLLLQAKEKNDVLDSLYHVGAIGSTMGRITELLGRPGDALSLHERAKSFLLELDDKWRIVSMLIDLASAQMSLGQSGDAADSLSEAKRIAYSFDLVELQAHVTLARGYQRLWAEDSEEAAHIFADARKKMIRLEREIGVVEARVMEVYCHVQMGCRKGAQTDLGESLGYVAQHRLDGAYQRECLYRIAYEIARELNPDMQHAVLKAGTDFIRSVVADIEEPVWKESYLRVKVVKQLLNHEVV